MGTRWLCTSPINWIVSLLYDSLNVTKSVLFTCQVCIIARVYRCMIKIYIGSTDLHGVFIPDNGLIVLQALFSRRA